MKTRDEWQVQVRMRDGSARYVGLEADHMTRAEAEAAALEHFRDEGRTPVEVLEAEQIAEAGHEIPEEPTAELISWLLGRLGFHSLWSGDYHRAIREALGAHLLRLQLAEAVVTAFDIGQWEDIERALNAYHDVAYRPVGRGQRDG
jgi:hypothetical protein